MKRVAWLGILVTLGGVAYMGYTKQLPAPLQERVDNVGDWLEDKDVGRMASDLKSKLKDVGDGLVKDDPETSVKPPMRRAEMPGGSFVPLALVLEQNRTHLIYLSEQKPHLASFKGLISWDQDTGLSRVFLEKRPAPLTDPRGKKLKTRRKSFVKQLRRFEYASGEARDLQPKEIKGIVLEADDLLYPDEFVGFFLEEERVVLSVFGPDITTMVHRATFMGGAHPAETSRTERVDLEEGATLSPRFDDETTAPAAMERAKAKGEKACLREHLGSVSLRGPGGEAVPAAVLGAAYESCRGQLDFVVDPAILENLRRKGIELGHGAVFRKGAIYMAETPILDEVSDVVVLDQVQAVLAVRGKGFAVPNPSNKGKKRDLVFRPLDRTSKPQRLLGVRSLVGSISLDDAHLDDKDLAFLQEIFKVRSPR